MRELLPFSTKHSNLLQICFNFYSIFCWLPFKFSSNFFQILLLLVLFPLLLLVLLLLLLTLPLLPLLLLLLLLLLLVLLLLLLLLLLSKLGHSCCSVRRRSHAQWDRCCEPSFRARVPFLLSFIAPNKVGTGHRFLLASFASALA